MPRGRKKAQETTETKDPMEVFREALNDAITADPEGAAKMLQDVLQASVPTDKSRTVGERIRTVTPTNVEIPPPEPPKAPEPKPGVVWYTPHKDARQVLRNGRKVYDSMGNPELIPPVIREAERNHLRLEEPWEIERMREIVQKHKDKGRPAMWLEIRDEIAEAMKDGRRVESIESEKVTVHTPLTDLVTVS